MRREPSSVVMSIYDRVDKMRDRNAKARDEATDRLRMVMLRGKVKAYTDVLCLIQNRYSRRVDGLRSKKKIKP